MSVRLAPSDKGITGSVEDGANMKTQLADLRRRPTIAIAYNADDSRVLSQLG